MNNPLKIILSVVAFLAIVAGGVISKTAVQKAASPSGPSSIDQALREAALEINKTTPMQVDKNTQLMNAVALGSTLRYRYTLVNVSSRDFEKNSISKFDGDRMRGNVCSSAGMQPLVKLRAVLEYAYYDKDGVELEIVSVETSKCQ